MKAKPATETDQPGSVQRFVPSWLFIDAARYALGRQSYQVGVTTEWLVANWVCLPEHSRQIIQKDVEEAFAKDDRLRADPVCSPSYYPLGADMDRKCWETVRALWRPNDIAEPSQPKSQ